MGMKNRKSTSHIKNRLERRIWIWLRIRESLNDGAIGLEGQDLGAI